MPSQRHVRAPACQRHDRACSGHAKTMHLVGLDLAKFLDRLGLRVEMYFVLYQFPRNSRHISRLPCKDIPIFLKEFDKRGFLFGVQVIPHVSNLAGLLRG
jgi:hypothetical protein